MVRKRRNSRQRIVAKAYTGKAACEDVLLKVVQKYLQVPTDNEVTL